MFGAFTAESRIVGLIAFVQEQGAKVRHKADIYQVYVRPEARGTGCGLALVNRVVEHARPLVAQIHLYVSVENKEAIRLYERAGFHIYGTEPRAMSVDGRYIDEHMMVRFLDEGARKEDRNE
jgi:ribosomal protein S18 acetylase RimI-like enzyme